MMKRLMFAGVLCMVMAVAAMMLAGCSSQASSSSASSAGSQASSSDSTTVLDGEDVVTITLEYNAGTGYEWQCTMDPEGVVSQVDKTTTDESGDKNIVGGALQDHFTFRAVKPGEVTLTFNLKRSWEDESAETQTYSFTVSEDLKMILNPYKSTFVFEPEWGSNS